MRQGNDVRRHPHPIPPDAHRRELRTMGRLRKRRTRLLHHQQPLSRRHGMQFHALDTKKRRPSAHRLRIYRTQVRRWPNRHRPLSAHPQSQGSTALRIHPITYHEQPIQGDHQSLPEKL